MKKYFGTSFAYKLANGWTKLDLMQYYALSELQYSKAMESLEDIQKRELQRIRQ